MKSEEVEAVNWSKSMELYWFVCHKSESFPILLPHGVKNKCVTRNFA